MQEPTGCPWPVGTVLRSMPPGGKPIIFAREPGGYWSMTDSETRWTWDDVAEFPNLVQLAPVQSLPVRKPDHTQVLVISTSRECPLCPDDLVSVTR